MRKVGFVFICIGHIFTVALTLPDDSGADEKVNKRPSPAGEGRLGSQ
jgi:hypothetical protein